MIRLRSTFLFASLALAGSALADLNFNYTNSDTRSLFQDLSNLSVGEQGYGAHLSYENNGGTPLYLNGVSVVTDAGFDSNIHYTPASGTVNYYDYFAGHSDTYTFGTPIADGSEWDINSVLDLDVFGSTQAAVGTYDFTVQFLGGADASASGVLQSLDLHVEVAPKLDIAVAGSVNDIVAPGDVAHLSMSVKNNMAEDFVSTTWFIGSESYHTDPSDPSSPHLDGSFDFTDTWFDKHVASGDTLTGAHSNWTRNDMSEIGTYQGRNGVVGGLHNGDFYFVNMDPTPDIHVLAVPEPTSMVALGLGALGLLRRRRKA